MTTRRLTREHTAEAIDELLTENSFTKDTQIVCNGNSLGKRDSKTEKEQATEIAKL